LCQGLEAEAAEMMFDIIGITADKSEAAQEDLAGMALDGGQGFDLAVMSGYAPVCWREVPH
jgi:hypothetical protein